MIFGSIEKVSAVSMGDEIALDVMNKRGEVATMWLDRRVLAELSAVLQASYLTGDDDAAD